MPRKIVAGNWKMNGTKAALKELLAISIAADDLDCTAILCPPATLLQQAAQSTRSAPVSRTEPGSMAFTVAAVPTGIKAGVRILPRGVLIVPRRALPEIAFN